MTSAPPYKKIFLLAGEASGDLLGANLANALLTLLPDLELMGIGGVKMQQSKVKILMDMSSLDVVGLWEVIKNLITIRRAMQKTKFLLRAQKPDLLILIDYPGFNLRMAQFAKSIGIKVLYYVSPQVWAWRYQRIHHIKKYVDHMAVLFPFETKIYQKENIPVTFVGHPLAKLVQVTQSQLSVYHQYGLNSDHKVIALLPGSRQQEIRLLLPLMVATIPLIRQKIPDAQFVLPLANTLQVEDLKKYLTSDITVIKNNTYNILSLCSAAMVTSGTATLEVALCQVPLVVVYKTVALNYWIGRCVIRLKEIGLCNIVAQQRIVQELIQSKATPIAIATEVIRLVTDLNYRQTILENIQKMRLLVGDEENSMKMAELVLKLL